jgi:UDPglucose 6-dehydrogenase
MNICVVGGGYVGLVTAACFAEFGVDVICVEADVEKVAQLQAGRVPIFEPGLEELVSKNLREGRLRFTTQLKPSVEASLVVFVAVGTPPQGDGSADLRFIDQVAREIAEAMDGYKVIVTKSTVPVGTGSRIREIIETRQTSPIPFDVASNPEFLREGSAIEDFMRPNRVVIGAGSDHAIAIMKDLYRPLYLIETPILITDVETAEMVKYASNAFLATKISFINEVAQLCDAMGVDVHVVAKGMGLDSRIGPKFLHPGAGFGGSCFPKDSRALMQMAAGHGMSLEVLDAVIRVNEAQRARMLEKVRRLAGGLEGKTIAVLGLAFKPNTDDLREAPALDIVRGLLAGGASVKAYDPAAMDQVARLFPEIELCKDAYAAADGADALVLVTEWNQFRNLDLARIRDVLRAPVLIDCRNVYDPARMAQLGFRYEGVGRSPRPASGRAHRSPTVTEG